MKRKNIFTILCMLAVLCISVFAADISQEDIDQINQAIPEEPTAQPKQPRKMLVFNRCEGYKHASIDYVAAAFEMMGEQTGAFETVNSTDMNDFTAENLKQYDAVCFNNTTRLKFENPAHRKALMDFIKNGKGIVGIHAATDNFYTWPEAAEMMGGLFNAHPWHAGGTWTFKLDDPDHPVNKGFEGKGFVLSDEIYQLKDPYTRKNLRVLVSLDMSDPRNMNVKKEQIQRVDNDFAVSWIRDYGKGRLFYCSLGHNKEVFFNKTVMQHYLDGIQFALGDLKADATPSAVIAQKAAIEEWPKLLGQIKAYKFGDDDQVIYRIKAMVRENACNPKALRSFEADCIEFLGSDATIDAKQIVCKQLSIFATADSIPVLKEMLLADAKAADNARYVLERMESDQAVGVLLDCLGKTEGSIKIGIVNSLGHTGSSRALTALKKLAKGNDSAISTAAIQAIGQIGGTEAAGILKKLAGQSWKSDILAATYFQVGDSLVSSDTSMAESIFESLYQSDAPVAVRIGAYKRLVDISQPNKKLKLVKMGIADTQYGIQPAALELVDQVTDPQIVKLLENQMSEFSPAQKVYILAALGRAKNQSAVELIKTAADDTEVQVRIEALQSLKQIAVPDTVGFIAQKAANASGQEQNTARQVLYSISAPGVNDQIVTELAKADDKVKIELIKSLDERQAMGKVSAVLKTAKDAQTRVRIECFKALRNLAGADEFDAVLELYLNEKSSSERNEAETTLATVTLKTEESRGTQKLLALYEEAEDEQLRESLLNVFAKMGSSETWPVLKAAMFGDNPTMRTTAIRALMNWPDDKPLGDMEQLLAMDLDKKDQVLGLRSYLKLIENNIERPGEQNIELYKKAFGFADDASMKKNVLSSMSRLSTYDAALLANQYSDQEDLKAEAQMAVIRIAQHSNRKDQAEKMIELLNEIKENAETDTIKEEAQKALTNTFKQ